MVIRDVVPRAITTLSVPFWRFGKVKIGGRGTIGMRDVLHSRSPTNSDHSATPIRRSRCLLARRIDRRREVQSLRTRRSEVHRRTRRRGT
jgi:hypothetical protein